MRKIRSQTPAPPPSIMANPQASQAAMRNFPPLLLQQLSAIKSAALNDDYAYRQLAHLTENIGARPTGSLQATAAAQYVADEMRKLGPRSPPTASVVPHWVRGAETAALVEYAGMVPNTTQKIVLTALGSSTATPAEGLTADVIVVDTFEELQALGREKVAGQDRPIQRNLSISKKPPPDKPSPPMAKPFVIAALDPKPPPIWARPQRWYAQLEVPTTACRIPGSVFPPEFLRAQSLPKTLT